MYYFYIVTHLISLICSQVVAESPDYVVTAPQIICPRHTNNSLARPEYSIVTIDPKDNVDLNISWSISWVYLKMSTQRETLILWRKIRALQNKFNKPRSELTFVIKDEELLSGVRYIFNITATSHNGDRTKTIPISYVQGHKADKHGKIDMSPVILSGTSTYVDLEFVMEAQVTNCDPTLEYYFVWSVYSEILQHSINVTNTIGSRLEIPPYSLKPGATYESSYQVVRECNKEVITEVKSSFQVRYRGLKVYLNQDRLMVTVETAFTIEALVVNIDYYESNVKYEWKCFNNEEICNFIDSSNENVYNFSSGIPYKDEFRVSLTVTIFNESATVNSTIVTLDADIRVPEIQILPVNRIINENEETTLLGKAYDVAPSCNLSWYFVTEELLKLNSDKDMMEYGEIKSDSNRKLSLNEKFLGELIEFDYETKSIEIDAVITNAGKASLIAVCECINGTDYRTTALVYAEVNFKLNRGPIVHNLTVFPESGTALETIFRIYSKAEDTESPLLYSFYCDIGNGTLLLASYFDHWTVDTFLPYVGGGTDIWMVVCNSLGACSKSDVKTIELHPNNSISIDVVSKVMNDYIKRCEILQFQRIAISAIVSYSNAGQSELTIFTKSVLESLPGLHPRCLSESRYLEVLSKLAAVGVNTTSIFK